MEIEGTIVSYQNYENDKQSYDGDFDASELATQGDLKSLFETVNKGSVEEKNSPSLGTWTSEIQFSGAKKVVPGRIYSMAIHPQTSKLLVRLNIEYEHRLLLVIKEVYQDSGHLPVQLTNRL